MSDFLYKAARADGRLIEGRLVANGREDALKQLHSQRLVPVSLAELDKPQGPPEKTALSRGEGGSDRRFRLRSDRGRPSFPDVQAFTNELSIMLRAGLPLDRALRVLIGMTDKASMRAVAEDLLKSVKGGKGLSMALTPHAPLFGDFYISMVRSGEAGGQLAEVLTQLADHLERLRSLRESVVSALIYPAILLLVALVSVFLMLGFVVPQFESLFDDLGDALPAPTRLVVAAGDLVSEHGWALVLILVLAAWLTRVWFGTVNGRAWRDRRLLNAPVLGDVLKKYEITRFARSMGTLLGNGVPMVSALRIATATVGNQHLRAAIDEIAPAIKRGQRMADALEASAVFTPLVLNMVRLGEETGRLDEMLLEVAKVHDAQVQTGLKRALQLVEPVLILVLGGLIAVIIISILMGILSVNDLAM